MITKAIAAVAVLAALTLPAAPAKASASYYLIENDVVYTPYSSRQSIVGGPFDTWSDCSAMMRAEPSNNTPGESITYLAKSVTDFGRYACRRAPNLAHCSPYEVG